MGSGLGAGHKPRGVECPGSRAWGGKGHSWAGPDTPQRQVSYLRLPTPGPATRLALASHPAVLPNPPPSPLPGQSPTWQGGCAHLTLPYSLLFPGADSLPAPPPLPPRRNSEKPEGLGFSLPLLRARSSWMEQLGRGDPGVWKMVIQGNALGSRARASEEGKGPKEHYRGGGVRPKETLVGRWAGA